jgi:hypothetical protein
MTWNLPLQCRDASWLWALARGRLVPDAHQLGVGKLNAEIAKAALEFIKIEQPIAVSAGSPTLVSERMRWEEQTSSDADRYREMHRVWI